MRRFIRSPFALAAGLKSRVAGFEKVALDYFENEVGDGAIQRIDGIECFSPLPKFWFWRIRLAILVRRGRLVRKGFPSIWRSLDGMAAYGIAPRSA